MVLNSLLVQVGLIFIWEEEQDSFLILLSKQISQWLIIPLIFELVLLSVQCFGFLQSNWLLIKVYSCCKSDCHIDLLDQHSELCWPELRIENCVDQHWELKQVEDADEATPLPQRPSHLQLLHSGQSFSREFLNHDAFSSFFRWVGRFTRRTRGSSPSSSASTWWSTSSSLRPRTLISWWPRCFYIRSITIKHC